MIFRVEIDKYGLIFRIKSQVVLSFFLSVNQYGSSMLVNNQQLNREILYKYCRDTFIIIMNIYFVFVIIFGCKISKLGFGKI